MGKQSNVDVNRASFEVAEYVHEDFIRNTMTVNNIQYGSVQSCRISASVFILTG